MNKRLIMLLIILAALAASIFLQSQPGPSPQTVVHQHEVYPPESDATGFDMYGNLTTHLPIVILLTNGQQIPGADAPTEEVLLCSYAIVDNPDGLNHSQDTPTQSGTMAIKIRGNTSRFLEKKQYTLKTVDAQSLPLDVSLLGMPAESVWVLNGSQTDHSLIRNYMLYNISGEIMAYSPRTRLCEVFLTNTDGDLEYQGVYTMIEKPKVSQRRLNLEKYDSRRSETPYLLQMNRQVSAQDNYTGPKINHLVPDGMYAFPLLLEYPDPDRITPNSLEYIREDIFLLEKALYDGYYTRNWAAVENMLDLSTFVDYYLINEFFQNYDAGSLSTYVYKDLGGKFCIGPVWDFDGAMNNFRSHQFSPDDLQMKYTFYYFYLSTDAKFSKMCIERYAQLREGVLSEEYLLNYIDSCSKYLGKAALRNCEKWYGGDYSKYYDDIAAIKEFISQRGEWMDENFGKLSVVLEGRVG